ncbi:MAG: metal-sensitive transcriptional regulator [Verrucomicrobia bacterium]|nr:metal-sensitive transcriptional regulator [Verrucomicrobiota bacterium]MDA1065603.1 metal-sensitive transcriptional regulator [Verrucomicrobiota bacterium]
MILPEYKNTALRRLKIIQGQVGGVSKLVDEERYCLDILTQIAAIQEALRGVSRQVVRNHLETCVTDSIKKGNGEEHYKELTDIMFKLSK